MRRAHALVAVFVFVTIFSLVIFANAPKADTGKWVNSATLSVPRASGAATLLPDGRVLVTGGSVSGVPVETAEIIGMDGRASSAPSMNLARAGHAAVMLPTGYVLVIGGTTSGGGATNTAELFDPLSGTWTLLPSVMNEARTGLTATLLYDGNVLVAGGANGDIPIAAIECFDLWTETFSFSGTLNEARAGHGATLLDDGRVFLAGGTAKLPDGNTTTLNSSEIFNPDTNTITAGPRLNTPRTDATVTSLLDGNVLIAGGSYPEGATNGFAELQSAELFNPAAATITPVATNMQSARAGHQAIRLPKNNAVLLVGGTQAGQALASSEMYLPWTGQFMPATAMSVARTHAFASATAVDGQLLVGGGEGQTSTELYGFATVMTDRSDYHPGDVVTITGSGWQPGETVTLTMQEQPAGTGNLEYTVVADAFGYIHNAEYAPQAIDLLATYFLTAKGTASQAQTLFTDGPAVKVGFMNLPITEGIGACSAGLTVSELDANNAAQKVNPVATVNLSTSSTGGAFYSDNTCATAITFTTFAKNATVSPTFYYKDTQVGSPTLTATVSGLTAGNQTATITKGSTATTITSAQNPATYGQSSFTVQVAAVSPAPGTPTGNVNLYDGGIFVVTASLVNGTASVSLPALAVGSHSITASYAGDASFNVSSSSTLTQSITKASLTVGVQDATRSYGAANPTFTPTYSGFVNGDTASVLTGTLAFNTTATPASPAGNYTVTPSGVSAANYNIAFTPGTLTVTKAALTIGVQDEARSYGAANPTFTPTYGGFANGETAAVLTGTLAFNTTATAASPAGSYTVTPSGLASANYTITFAPGTLTVTKAALTIGVQDETRSYGAANPTFTPTYSGFANGETAAVLTGTLVFNTAATSASPAGDYTVTPSGLTSTNYNIAFTPGTLTIAKAALTIGVQDATRSYGAANPAFTPTYSGFANGETASVLAGTLAFNTTATAASPAGNYTVTPSGVSAANYNIAFTPGTLTVAKVALTVGVQDAARMYGTANPSFTPTFAGFVNGDSEASLGGTLVFDTTAIAASPAGDYTVTPSGVSAANYNITFAPGTLTVTKAALAIGVQDATRSYGAANPAFTPTYSGFANGETAAVLTGTLVFNTTATAASPAGDYTVMPSGATSANYTITFTPGTLTVSKAALIIGVQDATRGYGAANPIFTPAFAGLVNGDSEASLGGTLVFDTTATAASPAGDYPVTPSGLTSANYTITFTPGTLTVSKAALTIGAQDATRIYGAENPAFTPTFTGFVNGDTETVLAGTLAFNTTATAASPAGTYAITPSGLSSPNYNITFASGTLTVQAAAATITAGNASRVYGAANPSFTFAVSGLVNGDTASVLTTQPVCSSTATVVSATTTVSNPAYPIVCSGATAANYQFTYAPGALTVTAAPLTITPDNQTRRQGQANPALTGTLAGVKNADAITATYKTAAALASLPGTYSITVDVVSDGGTGVLGNYSVTNKTATMTVLPDADLQITALSFTGAAAAGLTISVTDTASNTGISTVDATYTRYYISTGTTKTGATILTGSRIVSMAGNASSTGTTQVQLPANVSSGNYNLLACADDAGQLNETNETNNCRYVPITVGGVDLTESAVSVSGTLAAGATVSVTDTANNAGPGSTSGSYTRYYLSTTTSKAGAQVLTGTRLLGAIAGGASATATTQVTLPGSASAGPYYLLACADDMGQITETDETNNCAAAAITLGGIDLTESNVSVSGTIVAGAVVSVTDTTTNAGPGAAASSTVRYYLSATTSKSGAPLTGTRVISALANGATSTGTTQVTLPTGIAGGNYYLLACADDLAQVGESNENNNCASASITVGGIDFTEGNVAASGTMAAGSNIQVTDTVSNIGVGTATSFYTRYYLSTTTSKTGAQLLTGTRYIASLATGAASTGTATVTLPATAGGGSYYILACADDLAQITETNEANNCASVAVTLGGMDLTESNVSAPGVLGAGVVVRVTDTVTNAGPASASPSYTRYYLSTTTSKTGAQMLTGSRFISTLASGASSTGSINVTLPASAAAGSYYLLACADDYAQVGESDETNNCASTPVTLGGLDLTETALSFTGTPATGATIQVTDTTSNAGPAVASAGYTRFYLSTNGSKTGAQILTGTRSVATVAGGAASTGTTQVTLPATSAAGNYFLVACADDYGQIVETNETNNCMSVPITLAGLDLTEGTITVPATVVAGAAMTVTDTVLATSPGVASGFYNQYYLSTTGTMVGAQLLSGSRYVSSTSAAAPSTGSVSITVPKATVAGSYFVLVCADKNNTVPETNETNNCSAAPLTVTLN